jgi:hypothetical protein
VSKSIEEFDGPRLGVLWLAGIKPATYYFDRSGGLHAV